MAPTHGELLARHQPLLKYDSQECYFADHAAIWVECPGNVLNRGAEIIGNREAGGELSLAFLGGEYGDGKPARKRDCVSDPGRDYRAQARSLHRKPEYRNRVFGRVTPDERWLQYWYFYFYNDYNLIGNLIGAGRHEGDWEMVQIHLDDSGRPDRADYAQHAHARSRPWHEVERQAGGERPTVYVARGSHAAYFESGPQWTGHWFDHADGRRASPEQELIVIEEGDACYGWLTWPGRWGDTAVGDLPIDSASPDGPAMHRQWSAPESLVEAAPPRAAAQPEAPAAPVVNATLEDGAIRLDYRIPDGAATSGLAVTVNSPDDASPPTTHPLETEGASGSLTIPGDADPTKSYELFVSQASAEGLASRSTDFELPAIEPR